LDPIAWADVLIVADAALMGRVPGTVARLSPDELHALSERKTSMHEVSLAETFVLAAMLGTLPETFIVAIEPQDVSSWDTAMSESVATGLDVMIEVLLAEIVAAGASYCRRAVLGGPQPGVEPVASRYGTR
jgi:hydrogenase maturation protease